MLRCRVGCAERNFRTVMVADGCAARTDADHNAALNSCVQIFGDVMLSEELLSNLGLGLLTEPQASPKL